MNNQQQESRAVPAHAEPADGPAQDLGTAAAHRLNFLPETSSPTVAVEAVCTCDGWEGLIFNGGKDVGEAQKEEMRESLKQSFQKHVARYVLP